MNVVDSSAWLEYFANGSNASFFAGPIEAIDELVVPSLTIYEVFNERDFTPFTARGLAIVVPGR